MYSFEPASFLLPNLYRDSLDPHWTFSPPLGRFVFHATAILVNMELKDMAWLWKCRATHTCAQMEMFINTEFGNPNIDRVSTGTGKLIWRTGK
eukprot:556765-Pelagomonas_calceolata.AAC.1